MTLKAIFIDIVDNIGQGVFDFINSIHVLVRQ